MTFIIKLRNCSLFSVNQVVLRRIDGSISLMFKVDILVHSGGIEHPVMVASKYVNLSSCFIVFVAVYSVINNLHDWYIILFFLYFKSGCLYILCRYRLIFYKYRGTGITYSQMFSFFV